MRPSLSVRLFAARLRLTTSLARIVRGFDGSDALTVLALAGIGGGVYLIAGLGPALLVPSLLVAAMTPIAPALRLLVRGR